MAPPSRTAARMALSRLTGRLADLRLPGPLRSTVYRTYAGLTGADLGEASEPLASYPSLGAFFVRHLRPGARPVDPDPEALVSPVDGRVISVGAIRTGLMLQLKGREYDVARLVDDESVARRLEGGSQWSLYLGPRDYHRIHAPEDVELISVKWLEGARYSVNPRVLARRLVLPVNERVVLELRGERGPLWLVMVGALNVGRMRILDVEPGASRPVAPRRFERGEELARFEMGSTIVLLSPPEARRVPADLDADEVVRLGRRIGSGPARGSGRGPAGEPER